MTRGSSQSRDISFSDFLLLSVVGTPPPTANCQLPTASSGIVPTTTNTNNRHKESSRPFNLQYCIANGAMSRLIHVCLILISCLTSLKLVKAQYFEEDLQSCSPDQVDYEWERMNYYEILGLSSSSSAAEQEKIISGLDSKDIRKSYRKQAQLWHPDKMRANETLAIDEINSRFGRINQAYQTLNDAPKRQAYNRFLENCQYMRVRGGGGGGGGTNTRSSGRQSSAPNSGARRQPSSSQRENTYSQEGQYQQHYKQQRHYHNRQRQQEGFQSRPDPPSSERKEREMLVDPMTGAPILRETTYQEYQDENYYRVFVEDYLVETMDAWGNTYYRPLYPYPQMVEEGQLHPGPTNSLTSGDVLRMEQVLLSSNGKYRVRIQHCQLVIEKRDEESTVVPGIFEPDVEIVWSSDNELPYAAAAKAECFLGFEQGQLMIAGGSPEFHTGEILWKSSFEDDDDNGGEGFGGFGDNYVARLENDGKLVIYEVDLLWSPFDSEKGSPGKCVYATGTLGCKGFANKVARIVKDFFSSVDSTVDSIFDSEDWSRLLQKTETSLKNAGESLKDFSNDAKESMVSALGLDEDGDNSELPDKLLRKAKETAKVANRKRKEVQGSLGQKARTIARNSKQSTASFFDSKVRPIIESRDWGFNDDSDNAGDNGTFGSWVTDYAKDTMNAIGSVFGSSNFDTESDSKGWGSNIRENNCGGNCSLPEKWLHKASGVIYTVNHKRKRVEASLEEKCLSFVQHVHLRWQELRQRSNR